MFENGYFIRSFLLDEDIERLRALYHKWHKEPQKEFFKSYFSPDKEYKAEVEATMVDIFSKRLAGLFHNFDIFGGLFVIKPPGEEGHFPPHQDWSFVDESKDFSIHIWCPLEDAKVENGCMSVLKGSHNYFHTIRGANTPDTYRPHVPLVWANMTELPMKAGEALVFHHGILHGSAPNVTDVERVAVGLTLVPKDADMLFHYIDQKDPEGKIERFKATKDFYINYVDHREKRPDSIPSLGMIEFDFTPPTDAQMREKILAANGRIVEPPQPEPEPVPETGHSENRPGFLGKLKRIFAG